MTTTDVVTYLSGRLDKIINKQPGQSPPPTSPVVNVDGSKINATIHGTTLSLDFTSINRECYDIAAIIYITLVHSNLLRQSPSAETNAAGESRPSTKQLERTIDQDNLDIVQKYFTVDRNLLSKSGDENSGEAANKTKSFDIITAKTCKPTASAAGGGGVCVRRGRTNMKRKNDKKQKIF